MLALPADAQTTSLDGRVGHLIDPEGRASVAQVRAAGRAARQALPAAAVRSGADGAAHWFTLQVERHPTGGSWVLALRHSRYLHAVQPIGPCAEPGTTPSACDGAAPPLAEPSTDGRSNAFLLSLSDADSVSYQLRAQSALPQNLSLSVGPFAAHDAARQARRLAYGIGHPDAPGSATRRRPMR